MINKEFEEIGSLTDHELVSKLIQEYERGMQGCIKNAYTIIDDTYPTMLSLAKDIESLSAECDKRFSK